MASGLQQLLQQRVASMPGADAKRKKLSLLTAAIAKAKGAKTNG